MFKPPVYYLEQVPGDLLCVKCEGVTHASERLQHSRVGMGAHEEAERRIVSECSYGTEHRKAR